MENNQGTNDIIGMTTQKEGLEVSREGYTPEHNEVISRLEQKILEMQEQLSHVRNSNVSLVEPNAIAMSQATLTSLPPLPPPILYSQSTSNHISSKNNQRSHYVNPSQYKPNTSNHTYLAPPNTSHPTSHVHDIPPTSTTNISYIPTSEKCNLNAFYVNPLFHHHKSEHSEKDILIQTMAKKMEELNSRIQHVEGSKEIEGLNFEDLCIHPDVELPEGYKPPKFEMFNGSGDPKAHLRIYCDKLVGVGKNEHLRMKLFIRSLTGNALEWYIAQDSKRWSKWTDMASDFMKRFEFNTENAPDWFYIQNLKRKPTESFREFAIRWRSEAARVQLPMEESQMKEFFIRSQRPQYYERMILVEDRKFSDIIKLGEKIEEGIKNGTITDLEALQASSRASQFGGTNENRSEKEVNVVSTSYGPSIHRRPPRRQRSYQFAKSRANMEKNQPKQYTLLVEPIDQLYERLRVAGYITPIPAIVMKTHAKWLDHTKICAYHSGMKGHTTEECQNLKDQVQTLIDTKVIHVKDSEQS